MAATELTDVVSERYQMTEAEKFEFDLVTRHRVARQQ